MYPAPIDGHLRPASIDEELAAIGPGGGAAPIAGGQSLMQAIKVRLVRPRVLVDLQEVVDLKLATAADVPRIDVTHHPTPCPHTPLGSRGIGEGRPSAIPGTLTNAICDALSPFGVEINEPPLRPDRLWRKLREARATTGAAAD